MNNKPKMILILGVTASGKSRLAFELAKRRNGEILSIDSMKVYRRMDIGTAKPSPERRQEVPYHLIDVVEPWEAFSAAQFVEAANEAIEDIRGRNKTVVAAGGTALYIKALLYGLFEGPGSDAAIRNRLRAEIAEKGLGALHQRLSEVDPDAAERIHPNDQKRIVRALEVYELTGKPISSFQEQFEAAQMIHDWTIIGLRRPREVESQRINARVRAMVDQGLAEEVRALLDDARGLSEQARVAIGYAEIIAALEGRMTLDEAIEKIKVNTRRFAKSQRTWFRSFREVQWIDIDEEDPIEKVIQKAEKIIHE